ncbi:aminotransferase [Streptomyces sp. NPDC002838]|uniref:type 1 glutamine amidotransferase n=1 Tax=Streptomyces sp. NPDC002838 TaxID=3154436 RepID=UPI00332964B5
MRALVVQHDHVTEPGLVGARLTERGYDLTAVTVVPEERRHATDVTFDFPDAGDWDLIVSLGAPWSVYDETAVGGWIGGEPALLRKAQHLAVPVLGVCFGAQALTAAGSVEASSRPEIGWTEVDTHDPSLVGRGPWLQWHYDRCVPPPEAHVVARNEVCVQAFRAGRSLGVQFHPEVTTRMLSGWLALGGAEQCVWQGLDPDELLARSRAMEPAARANARHLVDGFLDRVAYAAD